MKTVAQKSVKTVCASLRAGSTSLAREERGVLRPESDTSDCRSDEATRLCRTSAMRYPSSVQAGAVREEGLDDSTT